MNKVAVLAPAAILLASGVAFVASLPAPRPAYLPDPSLTPGAILPGVTSLETCDPTWTHRSRQVPDSLKVAVFRAYGIDPTPANRRLYEIDHRVPVALGGASVAANLSPEPWDGDWGAHTKDRLENRLWRLVCAGKMGLADAQRVFLGDWKAEYLRQFGDPANHKMGAAPEPDFDGEGFSK